LGKWPELMRRWAIPGAIAVVAVAALAVWLLRAPAVEVTTVVRRDVLQTVVASGRVAAPFRVDIGSQITGTVSSVPVAEGQVVKAGDTLVLLEASEAHAAVRQGEVAVAQAEARLRQLRELQLPVANQALRQAEANLANARSQLERNRQLYQSGFLGKSAFDDAQRNVEVSEAAVESARKQRDTARVRGSDYEVASTALDQARVGLQAARARLAYTEIKAPVNGTLIARDVERGEAVQAGKVLMVLSPAGETQLVLQIDERNLGRLKIGQPALASADAYPSERFAAELVYVNPGVDAQRGTVEVKLRVPQPPAYLRQDMTVSVDIEVERRPATLALRAAAVHDASSEPWVLVVSGGRATRQPVKLGLRGEGWVELLSGPREGEQVVATADGRVKPGQRVRAVPGA